MRHRGHVSAPTTVFALLGALALPLGAGCSSPAPFRCDQHGGDTACNAMAGAAERCIAGYCAEPTDRGNCPSGFRYTSTAQSPGMCAGDGADVMMTDATMDDVAADGSTEPGDAGSSDAGSSDAGADEGGSTDAGCTAGASEVCNGADDNCNGFIDEMCPAGLSFSNEMAEPALGITSMNGTAFDLRCPPGEVLTGVQYNTCPLKRLQLSCSTIAVTHDNNSPSYNYSVTLTPDTAATLSTGCTSASMGTVYACPANQVITQLQLKTDVTNTAIYTLSIVCSPVRLFGSAPPYTLTVGPIGSPSFPACNNTVLNSAQLANCSDRTTGLARGLAGVYNMCNGLVGVGLVCATASLQNNP